MKKESNKKIKFSCFRCRLPLKFPGALLFSPPPKIHNDDICQVEKIHICQPCYYILLANIIDNRTKS